MTAAPAAGPQRLLRDRLVDAKPHEAPCRGDTDAEVLTRQTGPSAILFNLRRGEEHTAEKEEGEQ